MEKETLTFFKKALQSELSGKHNLLTVNSFTDEVVLRFARIQVFGTLLSLSADLVQDLKVASVLVGQDYSDESLESCDFVNERIAWFVRGVRNTRSHITAVQYLAKLKDKDDFDILAYLVLWYVVNAEARPRHVQDVSDLWCVEDLIKKNIATIQEFLHAKLQKAGRSRKLQTSESLLPFVDLKASKEKEKRFI